MQILSNLYDAETNPNGYVSLGIAENSLMHDVFIDHMHKNMKIPKIALTYGDVYKRIKTAAARFLTKKFKPVTPIEPSHIHISNGLTPAIQNIAWAVADPGDALLLGRPYYVAFKPDASRRTGVEVVPVAFGELDPMGIEAVQKYEDEIVRAKKRGQRIAGIILAHPHNPLGRCYPRQVLVAFMKLCQKHQIHLISDEIYALSVFENRVDGGAAAVPFESVLSIDPEGIIDPSLIHVLWGMSKDFGANGLRMGITITQHNPSMQAALMSVFEFSWTSSLSDLVTANALEDDEWVEEYIKENQRKLSEHHEKVLLWAKENEIEYTPGSNAGFFVWANLGAVYKRYHAGEVENLDQTVMQALLDKKVFLADGIAFGAEQPGWFRIVFTQETEYLEEGLGRIMAAVKGT
jgi:aspartate/methionine/tyrosine aminotransferase